jgi:hypothetical protein
MDERLVFGHYIHPRRHDFINALEEFFPAPQHQDHQLSPGTNPILASNYDSEAKSPHAQTVPLISWTLIIPGVVKSELLTAAASSSNAIINIGNSMVTFSLICSR